MADRQQALRRQRWPHLARSIWSERRTWLAWLTSSLLHGTALVIAALIWLGLPGDQGPLGLEAEFNGDDDVALEALVAELPLPLAETELANETPVGNADFAVIEVRPLTETPPTEEGEPVQAAAFGMPQPQDLLRERGTPARMQEMLSGRSTPKQRQRLVEAQGGTEASEQAVRKALEWLKAHQRPDGSWWFAHHHPQHCPGLCRHPGSVVTNTGATGMALLPFLGAGQTHEEGEYQLVVQRAVYYLASRARRTPRGIDLQEGTMYAQGIAAIALCELYAMTGDRALRELAQGSLEFIVSAQDPRGGGWRYRPGQPGDTSMLGWQLMALRSGQMAYLEVPSETFTKANFFLDSVMIKAGAGYKYLPSENDSTPATGAIGVLCRMYGGWHRSHSDLRRGIEAIAAHGPSRDDMYFNYYATQALHHYGGDLWWRWNETMREYLIQTQATKGHEHGSWYFPANGGDKGGRLYNTAMAAMTLEVYYRHLPLYRDEAVASRPRP